MDGYPIHLKGGPADGQRYFSSVFPDKEITLNIKPPRWAHNGEPLDPNIKERVIEHAYLNSGERDEDNYMVYVYNG